MTRELLTNLVDEFTDDGPDRLVGIDWLERKVETDQFLVTIDQVKALAREPTSLAMRFSSSSNTSQSRFVKMSGRM